MVLEDRVRCTIIMKVACFKRYAVLCLCSRLFFWLIYVADSNKKLLDAISGDSMFPYWVLYSITTNGIFFFSETMDRHSDLIYAYKDNLYFIGMNGSIFDKCQA